MLLYQPVDIHATDAPYVHEIDAVGPQSKEYRGEADYDISSQLIQTFDFPQKLIPLDEAGELLRLWEPLELKVNPLDNTFHVGDWDITMPCDDVHLLPEKIARKFLVFFGKSETGRLSQNEEQQWLRILDTVDFQHFSVNRAPAHYMEGKLLRKTPHTRVEWSDGSTDKLASEVSKKLSMLKEGDLFSAYCKLGLDNEVTAIERVLLLES